jgi:hypothetical protein
VLAVGATALAETLGHGFDDWLTGAPGAPASAEDEERFQDRNRRSNAPIVTESDLRELMRLTRDGRTYRLIGFRTGGAVCLRFEGMGIDEGGDVACVPAGELERSQDLAVPLKVDAALREAVPGARASDTATFGLVAAETRRVVLVGNDGEREARVANGAFLSVTSGPAIEHTTLESYAIDVEGRRAPVPLAPALTSEIDRFETGLRARGPSSVERTVLGGQIGWLERREPRGEPLPAELQHAATSWPRGLPPRAFARVLIPDPNDFMRIIVGVRDRDPEEICFFEVTRGGIGGACSAEAELFVRGPFTGGWTYAGAGSQFVTRTGFASDDVARLELFLGTGERRRIALRDNVFVVRAARAKFPVRVVAYDAVGRVIGVETTARF